MMKLKPGTEPFEPRLTSPSGNVGQTSCDSNLRSQFGQPQNMLLSGNPPPTPPPPKKNKKTWHQLRRRHLPSGQNRSVPLGPLAHGELGFAGALKRKAAEPSGTLPAPAGVVGG